MDADFTQTTVQSKVKDAEIMRVPYIIVVGDKEEKEEKIAVRIRGDKKIEEMKVEKFVGRLEREMGERKSI